MPSITRDNRSFTLPLPGGLVTFEYPSLHRTRIIIPRGSKWGPGAHWHEHYVEHVRVLRGRVKVTINGVEGVKGPEDGVATFQLFDVHDFARADGGTETDGEGDEGDVIVEEWTDPADGFKECFFSNISSIFQDSMQPTATGALKPALTPSVALQLLVTIAYLDNFVDPFPFLPTALARIPIISSVLFGAKYLLTHTVYGLGSVIGRAAGYQVWFKEYTPKELWGVAERGPVPRSKQRAA